MSDATQLHFKIKRLECIKQQEKSPDEVWLHIIADNVHRLPTSGEYEDMKSGTTRDINSSIPFSGNIRVQLYEKDGFADPDDYFGEVSYDVSKGTVKGEYKVFYGGKEGDYKYSITFDVDESA